jgi:hypothetical protein
MTRIPADAPPTLSRPVRQALAKAWAPALAGSSAFFLVGLEVSVFGLPGATDPDLMLAVCWGLLALSLVLLNLAWVAAFARARDAMPAREPAPVG